MRSGARGSRRAEAASAALGARWCYFVLKGCVLSVILVRDGDLLSEVTQVAPSAVIFFVFFGISIFMYLALTMSDPGWAKPDDESGLLTRELADRNIPMHTITAPQRAELSSDTTCPPAQQSSSANEGEPSVQSLNLEPRTGRDETVDSILVEVAIDEATTRSAPEGPTHDPAICSYCDVRQLIRTKHCRDCGRCVHTFDHHCFWIGTCVGEGNRRLFWWYLLFEFVTVSWASSHVSSTFAVDPGPQWAERWLGQNIASVGALAVSVGFTVLLGGLLFFHTYLVCTGQTSWEVTRRDSISYLRGVPIGVYPFSEGCFKNIAQICLRPRRAPPREWARPAEPWQQAQRFWWLENEHWSCF